MPGFTLRFHRQWEVAGQPRVRQVLRAGLGPCLLALLVPLFVLSGCGGAGEEESGGTGSVQVNLVDAPATVEGIEALTVTFAGVSIHGSGRGAGWIDLLDGGSPPEARTFDLLQLVNGVQATLGFGDLSEGKYTQLRIVVQEATITVNGTTEALTIPSGEETGIKLVGPFTVTSGQTTELTVDFDAGQSVEDTGGGFVLHPTYRILKTAEAGSISGTVLPMGVGAMVTAYQAGSDRADPANIVTTTFVDEATGGYRLQALPEGGYDLEASAPGYVSQTELNVFVTAGADNGGHDFTLDLL